MALLTYDGFDQYAGLADIQSRVGFLQWSDIVVPIFAGVSLTTGRDGAGQAVAITVANGVQFGGAFAANLPAAQIGLAFRFTSSGVSLADFSLMDMGAGVPQLRVRLTPASGIVQVFLGLGETAIATSAPNSFSAYVWCYLEIGALIGQSGSFQVRINGSAVLTQTGVATQATTNAFFNGFAIAAAPAAEYQGEAELDIDDFYLTDTTTGPGTYPCNSFMGDVSVITLRPTANKSVQWTPLANTNWQEVGTATFEGDASYNYATAVGDQDLFTFAQLPTSAAAVFGVQTVGAFRKLNASAQTITQDLVSGGTPAAGAPLTLSLSYGYYANLWATDPNTGETWTPAGVNALVAGYTLAS